MTLLLLVEIFPQIETNDIDRWELIEMMKSMEYGLSEYMKELLIKGFVKTELINSWLSRKHTQIYWSMDICFKPIASYA